MQIYSQFILYQNGTVIHLNFLNIFVFIFKTSHVAIYTKCLVLKERHQVSIFHNFNENSKTRQPENAFMQKKMLLKASTPIKISL